LVAAANPESKNRILVIDDEPDITLTFEWILGTEGFEIDSFNDPHTALSNFSAGIYDIALIDFKMPKMDGFDLYRKLKNIDDNDRPTLPFPRKIVIVLTFISANCISIFKLKY
jgi:DNA-binding response OmpR family regulator